MSNPFKDRLKRLHDAHQRGRDTDNGPSGVYTGDDVTSDTDAPPEPSGYGWERLGAVKSMDYSVPLWVSEERCDGSRQHGDWTLDDCCKISHRRITDLVDDVPESVRRRNLLYMDTETTGLGDDALVFMLGIGFWDDDNHFVVQQFLLNEAQHEPALLEAFSRRITHDTVLVTFNGASFDVPLLKRRYATHDIAHPFAKPTHMDLLPMARRCFPELTSYKLSKLEREVLAFERVDDVPGREIPRRWWKYEKSHNAELMRGVLEHNRHDVVSMEALVAAAIADEPPPKRQSDDEPRWGFSRLGFKSLQPKEAPKQVLAPTDGPSPSTAAGPSDDDGATKQDDKPSKPRSKIADRLSRNYRLRGKFAERGGVHRADDQPQSGDSSTNSTRDNTRDSSPDAIPTFDTDPSSPAPTQAASERARQLKSAAGPLIDQKMWREAFPLLCELVALVPDDDWGLEQLAEYYRQDGDRRLAEAIESRK